MDVRADTYMADIGGRSKPKAGLVASVAIFAAPFLIVAAAVGLLMVMMATAKKPEKSEGTWTSFSGLWPLLILSVLVSVALKLYVDQDRIAEFLKRNQRNSVVISTGLAVTTPFCSCGMTAVVLGMMASTIPWAPIVAFMVASPLTSPEELFYSAGLFGWRFAITFFAASIILGLTGGGIAAFAEARGWLAGQARFASNQSIRVAHQSAPAVTVTQPQTMQFAAQGAGVSLSLPVVSSQPAPVKKTVTFKQSANETFTTTWKLLASRSPSRYLRWDHPRRWLLWPWWIGSVKKSFLRHARESGTTICCLCTKG